MKLMRVHSLPESYKVLWNHADGHFVVGDDDKKKPEQLQKAAQPQNEYEQAVQKTHNFLEKLDNVLNGNGWKTNAEVAAQDAQARADWDKAHPFMPYPEIKIGIVDPSALGNLGGIVTKSGGSLTEPKLPGKTIVSEDGVTVEHYTRSGDHGPPHAHVSGQGPSTRIGQNGKPLKGDAELSPAQRQVIDDNKSVIRKAIDQIGRWFDFNRQ